MACLHGCVCVCVCMCVCVCVYVWRILFLCVCVHTHIYIYNMVCVCVCVCVYVCVYVCVFVCVWGGGGLQDYGKRCEARSVLLQRAPVLTGNCKERAGGRGGRTRCKKMNKYATGKCSQ
jgi:hypothetical protein